MSSGSNEGDRALTQDIRQHVCELLGAHPLPSLSGAQVRPLTLLPHIQSLPPTSNAPGSSAAASSDRQPATVPTDILDALAGMDNMPLGILADHEAVPGPQPSAANPTFYVSQQPQGETSFNPNAFLESFLFSTLAPPLHHHQQHLQDFVPTSPDCMDLLEAGPSSSSGSASATPTHHQVQQQKQDVHSTSRKKRKWVDLSSQPEYPSASSDTTFSVDISPQPNLKPGSASTVKDKKKRAKESPLDHSSPIRQPAAIDLGSEPASGSRDFDEGYDESEPSDSDLESSPPKGQRTAARRLVVKSNSHGKAAAAEKFVDFCVDLLQAQDRAAEDNQPFDQARWLSVSSTKRCAALLTSIAKTGSGKKIWSPDEQEANEDKLTPSQIARVLKLFGQQVENALDVKPLQPLEKIREAAGHGAASQKPGKGKQRKNKTAAMRSKSRRRSTKPVTTEVSDIDEDEDMQGGGLVWSRSRSGSTSAQSEFEEEEDRGRRSDSKAKSEQAVADASWTPEAAQKLETDMQKVLQGASAAAAILALLSVDKLPKRLYIENLIESCLKLAQSQYASLLYPLSEWNASREDHKRPSLLDPPFEMCPGAASAAQDVLRLLPTLVPRITALLKTEDMPEQILITAIYIAIGPFLVDLEGADEVKGGKGKAKARAASSMGSVTLRSLRLSSLNMIRNVYAKHPAQRQWIVEEILTSLTKVPDIKRKSFLLRTGKHIHPVSALLLHLIQSASHNIPLRVRSRIDRIDTDTHNQGEDENIVQEAKLQACETEVNTAVDAAQAAASLIVAFLLKKTRTAAKQASETDYKAVLDNVVSDSLAVFDLEEWPGAQYMITVCMTRMFSVVSTEEMSSDANALKSACLDHLTSIAGRLYARKNIVSNGAVLSSIPQLLLNRGDFVPQFRELCKARHALIGHLFMTADEDGANESAAAFLSTLWAAELLRGMERLQSLEDASSPPNSGSRDLHNALAGELESLWSLRQRFETLRVNSQLEPMEDPSGLVAQSLAWHSGQAEQAEALLKRVLKVLYESPVASHRSKALRCLEAIVAHDADVFSRLDVRNAIEQRFKDSQASVRDVAFDLLGKHIMHRPDLALNYLPHIAERINDKGVNVRKRVVKMLSRLYAVVPHDSMRINICNKLLWRIKDEDSTVRDLAINAVFEVVFEAADPLKGRRDYRLDSQQHSRVVKVARILSRVASNVERMPPLEDAIKMIIDSQHEDPALAQQTVKHLEAIGRVTVDFLLELDDDLEDKIGCARVLEVLTHASPKLLSASQLSGLIHLLAPSHDPVDKALRDCLLRALTAVVPTLPASALPVCRRLQTSLMNLLSCTAVLNTLQAIIACLCTAVTHQTKDYSQLCRIFVAMLRKMELSADSLKDLIRSGGDLKAVKSAQMVLNTLVWNVGLLCEHANFDRLRESDVRAEEAVDSITQDEVVVVTFTQLVTLFSDPALRSVQPAALTALGFIFRAFPVMMVSPEAIVIMDEIFQSGVEQKDAQIRLLLIIQDFLASQAAKAAQEHEDTSRAALMDPTVLDNPIDISELIGNTDAFADSGVSSAIVQRHLHAILRAAQSTFAPARNAAFEIIGFTVRQGLAHPLACLPTIVSIECSADASTAKRAFALHSILHQKHSGLIHTRFLECARTAFAYQRTQFYAEVVPRGTRLQDDQPVALFASWYSLVKEKRHWRREFVKNLLKGLIVDPAASCDQDKVDFVRFLCDNLATLEYAVQEDIFTIVKECDRLLAETAMQTLEGLYSKTKIEAPAGKGSSDSEQDSSSDEESEDEEPRLDSTDTVSLARVSMVLSLVALLRNHLKRLYGLSDVKCAKFVPGSKTLMGDKVPLRDGQQPVALDLSQHPSLQPRSEAEQDLDEDACRRQTDAFAELIAGDSAVVPDFDEMELDE